MRDLHLPSSLQDNISVCFHNLVLYSRRLSHPSVILVTMNNGNRTSASANEAVLLAPWLAVGEVSSDQLQDRIKSTIRVQNQVAAIRAQAVAELRRREGTEITETVLREGGLLARGKAKSELETAQQLEELPKTREGLEKGEISPDNARIIAGASRRGPIDEEELAEIAKTQAPDKFAGTVRRHERDRSPDDGESNLKRQRQRRFARVKTDVDDGMFVLYGRFDPVAGARIETALSAKMGELWRAEDPGDRVSAGQRMADALEQLLTGPRKGKDGRVQDVKLLLIADYNTVNGQLEKARLGDGTPVPASELRRLACDAQILPAIFAGGSQPMDLGRARRTANGAQRAALIARDRHCVGCGAKAAWCQAHHIEHWADGGPTSLDNMVLLCSKCHHKVHDNDWQIRRTPTGQYTLRRPLTTHKQRPRRTPYRRRPTTRQRK